MNKNNGNFLKNSVGVIVVGVNRGGTSAVAATLNAIDVPLGESWHEPIYEDLDLADAFRTSNWKKFKDIVDTLNMRILRLITQQRLNNH